MRFFAAAFVITVALGAADEARACTCIPSVLVAPTDGSVDVVRDAKVWVAVSLRNDAEDITLVDDLDRNVPGRWTSIVDDDEIAVFHPDRPLASRTAYRVHRAFDDVVLTTFTTGEEFSRGPPVVSAVFIDSIRVEDASSCSRPGEDDGHLVIAAIRVEHDGVFLAADVDETSAFDVDLLDGDVVHFVEGGTVAFGDQMCIGIWPGAAPLAVGRARVGAFDIAGNFSGWSDEILVEVPDAPELPRGDEDTTAGCATTGAPLLVALAAFIRCRRSR